MRRILFFCVIAVSVVLINPGQAQNTSALFLEQSLGARAVALGESYVAVPEGGGYGQYWNPASVAGNASLQIAYTHRPSPFRDVLNYEYFAGSYGLSEKTGIAASYTYVDFGEQTVSTGPGEFETFDSYSSVAMISVARQITNGLSGGITLKSIFQELPPRDARTWAADFGLIYAFRDFVSPQATSGQLSLGASLSNLGQDVEFFEGQSDPLPRLLRLGTAYQVVTEKNSADTGLPFVSGLVAFEYQNILNSDDDIWEWGIGAELKLFGVVAGRIGYHERHPRTDGAIGETFATGMTYGAGATIPLDLLFDTGTQMRFQIDYASAPQGGFVEDYDMFTFLLELGI